MSRSLTRRILAAVICVFLFTAAASTVFAAAKPMTRAEFVAMISGYFAWPHPDDYNDIWKTPLKEFNDVKTEDKFGKLIETAYEEGLIAPDAKGNFNPEALMTRVEAAVIFAKAFKVAPAAAEELMKFEDAASVSPEDRIYVNAILAKGYMIGKTDKLFAPTEAITDAEAATVFERITTKVVTPVQALPKQNAVAPRRYVKLYCPTPGATIHYTTDGTTPTAESPVYTVETKGHINEILSTAQLPRKDVVYRAIAIKDGLEASPVQTFVWKLYRPVSDNFQHDLILAKTPTSPAVYRIYNDSESVRAMAWYIEGQQRGMLVDALQTRYDVLNLKDYIDKNMATLPYSLVIGHTHVDHHAQAPNFVNAGVEVYANVRGWSALTGNALLPTAEQQAKVKDVEWGDVFELGGCTLHVYALPGHADGNVILQDKANGLIFASDIYGCTRAGSADNVNISGVRVDLLLSLSQQVYSAYKKDGGKTTMLFTGHDETPLGDNNLKLFEAALQQVVDKGEAGCSPTLRGNNDAPNSRTTIIGDMWKDGTNWIALKLAGIMGDATEYLTSAPINYNGAEGYRKYSVLSNIEFTGGELVGVTVTWGSAPAEFKWAGAAKKVTRSMDNLFDPWTYDYVVKVPASISKIGVIPTSMSTKITSMKLNGKAIASRSLNEVEVKDGSVITIEVVAPDWVTTSTYTFTVVKV